MKEDIFPGVSDGEVTEWQKHPVTRAFVATLLAVEKENTEFLVEAVGRDSPYAEREAVRIGGRIDGINIAKRIAEENVR